MLTKEGFHVDPSGDVYDAYPNGMGEIPSGVPGSRRVGVPGLQSQPDFLRAIRKGGLRRGKKAEPPPDVRGLINELRDTGKIVGLKWAANEVTVFVADHRKAILGTVGMLATIAGAAGAIYLARRSPRKK